MKLTMTSALSVFCSKIFVDAPLSAGMELTESDWSRDFDVTDQDVSQKRSFNIVEGSLNVSSPSLGDLVDPFSAEPNGRLSLLNVNASVMNHISILNLYIRNLRSEDCGQLRAFN